MTRKQRRLAFVASGLAVLGLAVALALTALSDSIVFFYGPSDALARGLAPGQHIRVGGLVEPGSVVRGEGTTVSFVITDGKAKVTVRYTGVLPDLFREGQGVVTMGAFDTAGIFVADEVLAKHDETYMPPEVAEVLKRNGEWRPEGETPAAGEGGS